MCLLTPQVPTTALEGSRLWELRTYSRFPCGCQSGWGVCVCVRGHRCCLPQCASAGRELGTGRELGLTHKPLLGLGRYSNPKTQSWVLIPCSMNLWKSPHLAGRDEVGLAKSLHSMGLAFLWDLQIQAGIASVHTHHSPSRLKILSPSASTMSFSAASSVTLKKCLSSGSLAMYLISFRKVSGLIPLRL